MFMSNSHPHNFLCVIHSTFLLVSEHTDVLDFKLVLAVDLLKRTQSTDCNLLLV